MEIALAVPFFLALMALEALVNRWRRGETGYVLSDTLANLGCGIGQQLVGLLTRGVTLAGYLACAAWVPWSLPEEPWSYAVALVGVDLCYYWFHRAGHRVTLLWAGHAVHHQSEEMNLSVALRQSWFVHLLGWVFYLPLALLGVSARQFLVANLLVTLYQFWIHTEAIGRLWAPLEWVFNTASHHRVHHGRNPRDLDANYGGVLILWDRLFGTFVPELEPVVYGTVTPLGSASSLWANLAVPWGVLRSAAGYPRWRDRLAAWLAPPEWRPSDTGGPRAVTPLGRAEQRKHRPPARRASELYVVLWFGPAFAAAVWLLVAAPSLGLPATAGVAVAVLLTLQTLAGLLEARPWARPLEALRLLAGAGLLALAPSPWGPAGSLACLVALGALAAAPIGRAPVLVEVS